MPVDDNNYPSRLFDLAGRVAVVTGGAGLYGRHISTALADAGAHVVVASRDFAACSALAHELVDAGFRASAHALDLSSEDSIVAARDDIVADLGHVDVLVNASVHRQGGGVGSSTPDDWEMTSRVNATGLFLSTRAFGEHMADRGTGSVINIGSIYGVVGPDFTIYGSTGMTTPAFYAYDKGGMVSLTRYFATYYGSRGVRVNCISAGGLETDQPAEFIAAYCARTPLGRMAGPEDIKGAVVFLAADASAYVTGVNLMVDGGWTAH
jgi:NAD(P)-dependent dehydrogenase (short-subunit alcohol dehydrogenase family)